MNTRIIESQDGQMRQIVDADTGELLHEHHKKELWVQDDERVRVYKPPSVKKKLKQHHFIKLYRVNWCDIISSGYLTKAEIALVASLFACIDWESNYVIDYNTKQPLNETTLAKAINYDIKNLRKQLSNLEAKGIIIVERGGKGTSNKYLFNPNIALVGKEVKNEEEFNKFNNAQYRPKSPIRANR